MALDLPLAVRTQGPPSGPEVETFVLLHGYGASVFTWRHWASPLARRGHVVLVDLKGFGSAPKPDDEEYGPHEQAELVHRLIHDRDLGNLTLVGHSLGGGLALLLGLRLLDERPARLRRLVIVAGAAYRQKLPPFVRLAQRPRVASLLMRLLGARLLVDRVLRRIVYDPGGVTPEQVDGYAAPLAGAAARRALIRTGRSVLPDDLDDLAARYPSISVPTLLIWGRQDPVVPTWVGERLAEQLPRARLEVLEECGHLPAEEHPVESLRALERFLDETRPGL